MPLPGRWIWNAGHPEASTIINHYPSRESMNPKPIVPWIGGKRRLAKLILPHVNGEHECYVEPFCGAAAIFFLKEPISRRNILPRSTMCSASSNSRVPGLSCHALP